MPTQSFRTFETFFDAVRHASLRATLLGRDRGDWALTHLIANNVSVQWGQAGGKAVVEGATRPGGLSIFLQTQGAPSFSGNGRPFDDLSLMVVGPGGLRRDDHRSYLQGPVGSGIVFQGAQAVVQN